MNICRGNLLIATFLSVVLIYFGGGIAITKCCHDKIVYSVNDDCCHNNNSCKHGIAEKSCMNVIVIHLSPTTYDKQSGKTVPQINVYDVPVFLQTSFFIHLFNDQVIWKWYKPVPNAPPKTLLSLICTFII